jgi:hypothetical protein
MLSLTLKSTEEIQARKRRYRSENSAAFKERDRQYRMKNPESIRKRDYEYRTKHSDTIKSARLVKREAICESDRQYRAVNGAAISARDRAYRATHNAAIREYHATRQEMAHEVYLQRSLAKNEHYVPSPLRHCATGPRQSWKSSQAVRGFFETAALSLHVDDLSDWYRVSRFQIKSLGGMP